LDGAARAIASTVPVPHACKSASWRYPNVPATSAPRANPRRD